MKVLIFKAGKKEKKHVRKEKNPRFGFERVLFFSFVCIFLTLIAVQTAMMNPSVRTFLVDDSGLEGSPLSLEEYLYSEGEISLALCEGDYNEDLKVLVNGDEVAVFSDNVVNLMVKDGDVIEVDGSLAGEAEVEIISASENIANENIGKIVKVNSDVKELTKITIE
ncbi:MAG: hypothetical protein ACOYWZ_21990 [Bacillota bacterium]